MATSAVFSNNTVSPILLETVNQTIPAAGGGNLTVTGKTNIVNVLSDASLRAGFSSGAISVSVNGLSLSKDAVGSDVISDICTNLINLV